MSEESKSKDKYIRIGGERARQVIRAWEDLYDYGLLPLLLARPPLQLFPRPLVAFAESVLAEAASDIDWISNRRDTGVRTVLGDVLRSAGPDKRPREFSAVAMEFAGYKFEQAISEQGNLTERGMCHELLAFLDLIPRYIRQVGRGPRINLQGTLRFRRETGMRLWLALQ